MSFSFMTAVKARVEARRAAQHRHYASADQRGGKLVRAAVNRAIARHHERAAVALRSELTAEQWASVEQLLSESNH